MKIFKGQTKRPNKTKSDRGITLVALIITIIILIILAAVTINSLTHDDLADMAIKGAQDYDKAQTDEMNMLNDIDAMVKDTIKNIESGTTNPDVAIESVTLKSVGKPNGSMAKVIATVQPENARVVSYKFVYKLETETDYKLGEQINLDNQSCNYTYTNLIQLVANNLKVIVTDYKGNSKEAKLDITPAENVLLSNTDIGKTVDYEPMYGEYSTMQFVDENYSQKVECSGYGREQSFTTSRFTE